MATFFLLVAAIGGVVVADLMLENPSAGEVTVFTRPVSGYSEGVLLAMAAALGFVVALLLVASMSSTRRRHARRKQLRATSASRQRQPAAPEQEQTSLLDEWFGHHVTVGDLGEPAPPTDREREDPEDRPEDHRGTVVSGRASTTPVPSTSAPYGPPTQTSGSRPTRNMHRTIQIGRDQEIAMGGPEQSGAEQDQQMALDESAALQAETPGEDPGQGTSKNIGECWPNLNILSIDSSSSEVTVSAHDHRTADG